MAVKSKRIRKKSRIMEKFSRLHTCIAEAGDRAREIEAMRGKRPDISMRKVSNLIAAAHLAMLGQLRMQFQSRR